MSCTVHGLVSDGSNGGSHSMVFCLDSSCCWKISILDWAVFTSFNVVLNVVNLVTMSVLIDDNWLLMCLRSDDSVEDTSRLFISADTCLDASVETSLITLVRSAASLVSNAVVISWNTRRMSYIAACVSDDASSGSFFA